MTNPLAPSDPKWKLTRYASPSKTQTSAFIALPQNHRYIRVVPSLTPEVHTRRRHRVFVMFNGQVLRQPNSTSAPGAYDVMLQPGDNVLSVEVLADLRNGDRKDYAPPQMQFDFEKCAMIINIGLVPAVTS